MIRKGSGVLSLFPFPGISVSIFDIGICISTYPYGYMIIFENGESCGFTHDEAAEMLSCEITYATSIRLMDSIQLEGALNLAKSYRDGAFNIVFNWVRIIRKTTYVQDWYSSILRLPERSIL